MLAIFLSMLLGTTCVLLPTTVSANKEVQLVENIIPYDQLMTPEWIESNAEITGGYNVTESYFEVLPTNGSLYERALRVLLIPPRVLTLNDSVTVAMIVAFDITIAQIQEHRPNFGLSDGKTYIGFETPDPKYYQDYPPCFSVNADVGESTLTNVEQGRGPYTSSTHYPTIVTTRFKPAEHWGSCETPQEDGGYNNLAFYQSTLDPSNGLYFELYHYHANEQYNIKYIQVNVEWD